MKINRKREFSNCFYVKIIGIERLIKQGDFPSSNHWKEARNEIEKAIEWIKWPRGSDNFKIFPEKNANGVFPISQSFMDNISNEGWDALGRTYFNTYLDRIGLLDWSKKRLKDYVPDPLKALSRPWFDVAKVVELEEEKRLIVAEWETGNISSSHRSLNRMSLGLLSEMILGGALAIPSRKFYNYLTDRVGNFSELKPFLSVWKSFDPEILKNGVLDVIITEYDEVSRKAPRIEKGRGPAPRK